MCMCVCAGEKQIRECALRQIESGLIVNRSIKTMVSPLKLDAIPNPVRGHIFLTTFSRLWNKHGFKKTEPLFKYGYLLKMAFEVIKCCRIKKVKSINFFRNLFVYVWNTKLNKCGFRENLTKRIWVKAK